MKKLMLLLAGAMALSFTANAVALFSDNEKWFDGGIKDGWPTTAENGGWDNTNGTTYAESKLTVSALAETPLTFTANVAKVTADYKATISSTVGFTAFEIELPAVPEDAKAGVIVYGGTYWALALDTTTNNWVDTKIPVANGAVAIDVTFLDPTNVVYTIGGASVTNTVAEAERIQNVCVSGDGTLAGLKATAEQKAVIFTIADADHTTKTVEGATLVSGNTYTALPGADVTVTYTADFGYFFSDGSKATVVLAVAAKDITIKTELERVVAAAKIGDDKDYFTLTNALAEAKSGDTVTLLKDIMTAEKDPFTINKSITLDFATYTVEKTVANDYTFDVTTNVTVTFTGTTGGVKQAQTAKNPTSPASMIRNKGDLTIAGGVYASDFCIIKNDEDPGAGTLTVNGGTFNIVEPVQGFKDIQMALMNWSTATINGGTWNGGTICTRSCDGNKVSKFGATEITAELEGSVKYLLYVGYPGDTTYVNVPKIKGVAIAGVDLGKVASITDELELVEDGDWVTVQKKLIAVESVTLDQTAVTTNIGETVQLTMTYAPEDADVVSTNWTSSAETVATVDQTGLVTAVAEGEATITVTVTDKLGNEKSATCAFTVQSPIQPIDPTKDEKIKCETEAEAVIAAALINNNLQEAIKAPDTLSEADQTIYRNMFQATADGTVVTIGLTETAEDAVQKDVNTNTVTESVAAALIEPTAEEVTINANVPGLYYWIEGAEAVGFEMPTNGPAAMATSKGSLELVKPGKAGTGAQQFYKVAAGVKDPNPEPVKK